MTGSVEHCRTALHRAANFFTTLAKPREIHPAYAIEAGRSARTPEPLTSDSPSAGMSENHQAGLAATLLRTASYGRQPS
jgi:hypothetical protein